MLVKDLIQQAIDNIDEFQLVRVTPEGTIFRYKANPKIRVSLLIHEEVWNKYSITVLIKNQNFSFEQVYAGKNRIDANSQVEAIDKTLELLLQQINPELEITEEIGESTRGKTNIYSYLPTNPKPPQEKNINEKDIISKEETRIMKYIANERLYRKKHMITIAKEIGISKSKLEKLITRDNRYNSLVEGVFFDSLLKDRKFQTMFKEFCWRAKQLSIDNPDYMNAEEALVDMISKRLFITKKRSENIVNKALDLSIPTTRKYRGLFKSVKKHGRDFGGPNPNPEFQ